MHFVTESATTIREAKRQRTEQQIARCAQQLTEEHGLDGFTMDELAARAELSRRTLFNYFPSKLDAVLGPIPVLTDTERAAFVAGGPSGVLLDDLAALARILLDSHEVERGDIERVKRIIVGEPRLMLSAAERFESLLGDFADLILEREGSGFDPAAARLLLRLIVAIFEVTMSAFVCGDDRPIPDLFDENLRTARSLLA